LANTKQGSGLDGGGLILSLMADRIVETTYGEMRKALVKRRQALAEEIGCHPRPITACDVHFNRLLEERAALSQELDRFDAFVAASPYLTEEAKNRIRGCEENVVCP
jgi:hypothetical protein